jgi:hypothetical protein
MEENLRMTGYKISDELDAILRDPNATQEEVARALMESGIVCELLALAEVINKNNNE